MITYIEKKKIFQYNINMKRDKTKEVATKIVFLEKECQAGNLEKMKDLDDLISKLSIEDMLAIDEYIYQENLLT